MEIQLGVDIGYGSIKIVAVGIEGGKLFLQALGEVATPKVDWLAASTGPKLVGEVAAILAKLVNDLGVKKYKAVVSLPEDKVISRLVRLPPMKENEVMEALRYEAETFIPYPLDQVSIDYEVVEEDESGRISVFALAAKQEVVKRYVDLFKKIGLQLTAVESPSLALRRAVQRVIPTDLNVLIMDLGETSTAITACKKEGIVFTRVISVGGGSMTRAVSVNLGLDMGSADEYKKAYGLVAENLEGKVREALMPVFENLIAEINKGLSLYFQENNKKIDLLVLTGGGANMPGMAEEITRLTSVEVQVIQPFMNIDVSRVVSPIDLKVEGCRFGLALGLAIKGWDVRP